MNPTQLARAVRRAKTLAEAARLIEQALDDARYSARKDGIEHEKDQQWLRDTTGPKPRIRITS